MIDPEKRKAIWVLHCQGTGVRKIAGLFGVDRNTVREIIKNKGQMPDSNRSDRIVLDQELLIRLYGECSGYIQRVHEKLTEEHGIRIGYSTLTRKIRQLELGKPKNQRCDQVADEPGAEMQHDTTVYKVRLGRRLVRLVASLIYLRFSKLRYLKFYLFFNRFKMKCFLHEALTFWNHSAPACIIDNTNLARLRGTGKFAVIVPEMERFARQYQFEFVCHEINHPNRKAGNERSFYTVETNFFPGREFEDLRDLNAQAFDWSTLRWANRPIAKSKLIPAAAFEYERAYLNELGPVMPPYIVHENRGIDQYGYVSFDGNFYWVPGMKRFDVKVIQFPDCIKIYHKRNLLIEYELPPEDVKNQKCYPPDRPRPVYQPKNRKKPTAQEENILRSVSTHVDSWLNFALEKRAGKTKHHFIRKVHGLYRKMDADLFDQTIRRALTYRIEDMETVERIAVLQTRQAGCQMPRADIDERLVSRPSFIEGRFTEDVDLSVYSDFEEEGDE
jgi:transposase